MKGYPWFIVLICCELHDCGLLYAAGVEGNEVDFIEELILFVDSSVDHEHIAIESTCVWSEALIPLQFTPFLWDYVV